VGSPERAIGLRSANKSLLQEPGAAAASEARHSARRTSRSLEAFTSLGIRPAGPTHLKKKPSTRPGRILGVCDSTAPIFWASLYSVNPPKGARVNPIFVVAKAKKNPAQWPG
jgi:hypothetical protein